jgi:hypothetical protein
MLLEGLGCWHTCMYIVQIAFHPSSYMNYAVIIVLWWQFPLQRGKHLRNIYYVKIKAFIVCVHFAPRVCWLSWCLGVLLLLFVLFFYWLLFPLANLKSKPLSVFCLSMPSLFCMRIHFDIFQVICIISFYQGCYPQLHVSLSYTNGFVSISHLPFMLPKYSLRWIWKVIKLPITPCVSCTVVLFIETVYVSILYTM